MTQLLSICLSPAPLHRRGVLALEIADGLSTLFCTSPLSCGEGLGVRFFPLSCGEGKGVRYITFNSNPWEI